VNVFDEDISEFVEETKTGTWLKRYLKKKSKFAGTL